MIDKLLMAVPGGQFIALGLQFAKPFLGGFMTALRNPVVLVMVAAAFFLGKCMGDREGYNRAAELCRVESAKAIHAVERERDDRDRSAQRAADQAEEHSTAEIDELRKRLAASRRAERQAKAEAAAAKSTTPEVRENVETIVDDACKRWAPGQLERVFGQPD